MGGKKVVEASEKGRNRVVVVDGERASGSVWASVGAKKTAWASAVVSSTTEEVAVVAAAFLEGLR